MHTQRILHRTLKSNYLAAHPTSMASGGPFLKGAFGKAGSAFLKLSNRPTLRHSALRLPRLVAYCVGNFPNNPLP